MIIESLRGKVLYKHMPLLNYLTHYTFSSNLPDKRAFNSLICLLPLPAQILSIYWSYKAELFLKTKYSKLNIDINIEDPINLLAINNKAIGEDIDSYYSNILNDLNTESIPIKHLDILLGIDNIPEYNPNDKYHTQISKTLDLLSDLREDSINTIVDIYLSNNRMRALVILLNYFGYEDIDRIMEIIDEQLSRPK
jgi:hypothetical protein